MIYKTTPFAESTDVTAILGDSGNDSLLPKIVYEADGSYTVLNTAAEQTAFMGDPGYPTGTETLIRMPATDLGLVYGSDYGVLLMLSHSANYVFSRSLPAPTIVANSVDVNDNTTIEWDSAYLLPTIIYRTAVYATAGTAPSEYTLIAEVDGYTVSGGTSTYLDLGITVTTGESVDYFVVNANGTSDVVTISVA